MYINIAEIDLAVSILYIRGHMRSMTSGDAIIFPLKFKSISIFYAKKSSTCFWFDDLKTDFDLNKTSKKT